MFLSCSRVHLLRFMYKICCFLWVKFQLPIPFLSIWSIYMLFMSDVDKVCNFLTLTKKDSKESKKSKIWNFRKNQNFEKTIIFLKVCPLNTLLFFQNGKIFFFNIFCNKLLRIYKVTCFCTWICIMCSFCMHETEEDVSKRKTCSSEEKDWDTKILKIKNKKIDKTLFKNETNLRSKYSLIQITFMIACLIGTFVVICYSCIFGSWKS